MNPHLAPFKRFLHSYREYLNSLQLFNIRAKFDCAHNKGLFLTILPEYQVVQDPPQNSKVMKETRHEAQLLGDPFDTRPFEN